MDFGGSVYSIPSYTQTLQSTESPHRFPHSLQEDSLASRAISLAFTRIVRELKKWFLMANSLEFILILLTTISNPASLNTVDTSLTTS